MTDFLPGSLYVDIPHTGIAVRRFQTATNFLAPFLAPRQVVKKPTGLYTVWRMGDLNPDELPLRGPSAPPATSSFNRDLATYKTDARSLAYDLNAAAQAATDVDSDPSVIIPMALAYKALISAEIRVANTFFTSTAWYRTVTGVASGASPGADGATTGPRAAHDRNYAGHPAAPGLARPDGDAARTPVVRRLEGGLQHQARERDPVELSDRAGRFGAALLRARRRRQGCRRPAQRRCGAALGARPLRLGWCRDGRYAGPCVPRPERRPGRLDAVRNRRLPRLRRHHEGDGHPVHRHG